MRPGYVRPLELLLNQCWDKGSYSPVSPNSWTHGLVSTGGNGGDGGQRL